MSSAIRPTRWVLLSLLALALLPTMASATWSVIAIDARTGRLIVASATCVPQGRFAGFPAKGLMDIQAIVVPGIGVAAAQAGVDGTRENQRLIYAQLKAGPHPEQILALLKADPNIERRQFGIIDRQGRSAGFSGSGNSPASLSVQARVPGTNIYYSVQGNILASDAVVHDAARALEQTQGTLADRVMAAMEAADEAGGDVRCTCEREPLPDAPCDSKNAHVAYILAADDGDAEGHAGNQAVAARKVPPQGHRAGLTVVPLKVYIKNRVAKLLIGLAKGKRQVDRRNTIKERDAKREIDRAMRSKI